MFARRLYVGDKLVIVELKMKKNKKEFIAITEDGENISLTPDAIVKYSISVGEVDDNHLENASYESACTFALNKATNWLTASYRSESELRRYLRERKYDKKIIDYVVNKLKEYNYLSDENLANFFVEYGQNKMGVYKMRQKLMEKGVKKDIIDKALDNIAPQDDICFAFAQKKLGSNERTRENMAKVQRYLLSKGFDYDTIRRTFNKLNFSEDD